MLEIIGGALSLLTSGAGGGLMGGAFGLFKQAQERKERVEMAKISMQRDQQDYENAKLEREHELAIAGQSGQLDLRKIETEGEREMEVANQSALSSAQDTLKSLNTSTSLDNYRASVRPTLAYWGAGLFSMMIAWAFLEFGHLITDDIGLKILVDMFATLTFITTSITAFYFVSRRNAAPR